MAEQHTPPYVLALDLGTSSIRALLFDSRGCQVIADGHPLATRHHYALRTTPDGGVEADAAEITSAVEQCLDELLAAAGRFSPIAAVATSSLVSNVLGVDADLRPLTPVYLYADTRNAAEVGILRSMLDERSVHKRCGTHFHTSYLPARFLWLQKTHPQFLSVRRWLAIGDFVLLRILGRCTCSLSVASWTGLLNRHTLTWDEELLATLPITACHLPTLSDAGLTGLVSPYADRWPALRTAVWFPAWGDGVCSNIGSGCTSPAWVAMNMGTSGALRIVCQQGQEVPWGLWEYRVDEQDVLVGGAESNAGNVAVWLRDALGLGEWAEFNKKVAAMSPAAHGLTVLPFLAGERSPGWRGDARAALTGLGVHTTQLDLLRAGLEAVAYRFALIYRLLRPLAAPAHRIVASGGVFAFLPVWGQIIADVLNEPIALSSEAEASARGAALLALRNLGLADLTTVAPTISQTHTPDPDRHAAYAEAAARQQRLYELYVG